jgi:hypothetical protein
MGAAFSPVHKADPLLLMWSELGCEELQKDAETLRKCTTPFKIIQKNVNSQGSKSLCMSHQHRASHHEQMVAVVRKGTYRINDDCIGCAVDFASVK